MDSIFKYLEVPKFDGETFYWWIIIMMTLLKSKELWSIVEKGYEEPRNWNLLEGEEKREKKEKQYENCLALMDLRRDV